MTRRILDTLNSLVTSLWLLGLLIALLVAGGFVMASMPQYASINDIPLLTWMSKESPRATWWLWAAVIVLVGLALNTLFCSAQSLMRKRPGVRWPLVISPQIIHAGLLFMLLAHLVSAYDSFKGSAIAPEGATLSITDRLAVKIDNVDVSLSREGYPLNWKANVEFLSAGRPVRADYLAPNRPAFFEGYGVYLKNIEPGERIACQIEVHRDPGAIWALVGGILFAIGTVFLFSLKISKEH